ALPISGTAVIHCRGRDTWPRRAVTGSSQSVRVSTATRLRAARPSTSSLIADEGPEVKSLLMATPLLVGRSAGHHIQMTLVHHVERLAAALGHAVQRFVGDDHRQAGLGAEQAVDIPEQGATAGEHDAG